MRYLTIRQHHRYLDTTTEYKHICNVLVHPLTFLINRTPWTKSEYSPFPQWLFKNQILLAVVSIIEQVLNIPFSSSDFEIVFPACQVSSQPFSSQTCTWQGSINGSYTTKFNSSNISINTNILLILSILILILILILLLILILILILIPILILQSILIIALCKAR